MLKGVLTHLFGTEENIPNVDHYEVKQYTGGTLQNTWNTKEVHDTCNGTFAFVCLETGSPVTVTGTVKVTGVLVGQNAPVDSTVAAGVQSQSQDQSQTQTV